MKVFNLLLVFAVGGNLWAQTPGVFSTAGSAVGVRLNYSRPSNEVTIGVQ